MVRVRTGHDADRPVWERAHPALRASARRATGQHVAGMEGASMVAAEARAQVGGGGAEHGLDLDAARHCEVATRAVALADPQRRSCPNLSRRVIGERQPIDGYL